jgi:hypothetical protein
MKTVPLQYDHLNGLKPPEDFLHYHESNSIEQSQLYVEEL